MKNGSKKIKLMDYNLHGPHLNPGAKSSRSSAKSSADVGCAGGRLGGAGRSNHRLKSGNISYTDLTLMNL